MRERMQKKKSGTMVQNVLKWPSAPKVTRHNVPRQLQSLVKKCPQWEDAITALVKSNENYMHFSYGEMEQEISGREILRSTWKMIEEKANNLVAGIQNRVHKVNTSTSFPLSEQNSFNSSVEHKTENLRKLADKFLFGGEVCDRVRPNAPQLVFWSGKTRPADCEIYPYTRSLLDISTTSTIWNPLLPTSCQKSKSSWERRRPSKETITWTYRREESLGQASEQMQKGKGTKEWWS